MNFVLENKNRFGSRFSVLLWLLLTVTAIFQANAQNDNISGKDIDENPKLRLGVKTGISLSTLESAELSNQLLRPTMAVGLYGNYMVSKKMILQVEMNGILKGSRFNYAQAVSLKRLSLFYFDMPVTAHFQAKKNSKLLPFGGVQPSLIFRKDAYKTQEEVPQPVIIDIKNYDLALCGGILYKINQKVGVQLMVNYGLININNQITVPFYPYLGNGSKLFNRNLQLCLVF